MNSKVGSDNRTTCVYAGTVWSCNLLHSSVTHVASFWSHFFLTCIGVSNSFCEKQLRSRAAIQWRLHLSFDSGRRNMFFLFFLKLSRHSFDSNEHKEWDCSGSHLLLWLHAETLCKHLNMQHLLFMTSGALGNGHLRWWRQKPSLCAFGYMHACLAYNILTRSGVGSLVDMTSFSNFHVLHWRASLV